jgi:hypothetical protein
LVKVRIFGLELFIGYVLNVWTVHDEGLKNMLMAWYYAGMSNIAVRLNPVLPLLGYYTGLHEGRQEVSGSVKPST